MTSYNHQKYLPRAIDSVLAQTFEDFELIIVDDASGDGSAGIIEHYVQRDSRVRGIFHDRNQGISRTTNDGFAAARGRFIAYVQSDDLWRPDKLEIQMRVLDRDPSLIVWSEAQIIDQNDTFTGKLFTSTFKAERRVKSGKLFHSLAISNYIVGQSMVFHRSVLDRFRFDPRLAFANDYKFMLDLSYNYQFHFIADPLVMYRIHESNSIHKTGKKTQMWARDAFLIQKYLINQFGNELTRHTKARAFNRIGKYLYSRQHYDYAGRAFCASIRGWPAKTSYYRDYLRCSWRRLFSRQSRSAGES